jgi:hypothetical protein
VHELALVACVRLMHATSISEIFLEIAFRGTDFSYVTTKGQKTFGTPFTKTQKPLWYFMFLYKQDLIFRLTPKLFSNI